MPRQYTISDMQEYAKHSAGKCLSKDYINSETPLKWRCAKGHTWDATFQIIKQGGWCRQCERERKKEYALENIKAIVAKHGFKCLSKEYINDATKLQFQCSEKHIWTASPNNIKKGSKCRKCADKQHGLKKRDKIETFYKIAKKHGGKCLSTVYTLNHFKLKFQCANGHVFQTAAVNVKTGRWCRKCAYINRANKQRHSLKMYREIAASKGGKCLSKVYIHSHQKLEFKCSEGHKWFAMPIYIKKGHWCATCGHQRRRKKSQ